MNLAGLKEREIKRQETRNLASPFTNKLSINFFDFKLIPFKVCDLYLCTS